VSISAVTAVTAAGGGVAAGVLRYERPAPPRQPVRLLPRPLYFAGRKNLLAELHSRLTDPGSGPQPRVVALCGLGGVGKTSTALTYAHDHLGEYDLVWQLPAEDEATLHDAFGQLARQLGAHDPTDPGADAVGQVHSALAGRSGRWLLFIDNAPDLVAVRYALPPAGLGCVLVTTRYQHWPHAQRLDVPVLEPAAATEFLLRRTGDADNSAAARLAEQLGYLPLALEQAAAYVTTTGRSLADYLDLFASHRARLLERGEPLGYDARVATTWSVSFRHLAMHAASAVALLRLLACYAPELVPLPLILPPTSGRSNTIPTALREQLAPLFDLLGIDEAIAALGRFSLTSPPRGGAVSVHRLVQAVTLDQLIPYERVIWQHTAVLLLEAALPDIPEDPRTWPIFFALLPHVFATLPDTSPKAPMTARYLWAKGDHVNARELWERILKALRDAYGERHKETLQCANNLALVLHSLGDTTGACKHLKKVVGDVVDGSNRMDEPDDLSAAMNNLAVVQQSRGDYAAAHRAYDRALQIRCQTYGEMHPDTLVSMSNLALMLHMQGRVVEARKRFEQVLKIRRRELGDDHPATLLAMSYVGMALRACGRLVAARRIHERALRIRQRVLGEDHPNTLRSMSNIGVVQRAYGDLTSARQIHEHALQIRQRVLGYEHPDTLRSVSNRAAVLADQGDTAGALRQFEQVLRINERVLGEEHGDTLNSMGYLAVVLTDHGDLASARGIHQKALEIRERVCGENHPDTLRSMNNLADVLRAQHCVDQAARLYEQALTIGQQTFGLWHAEVLRAMNNIGVLRYTTGDVAGAKEHFERLVRTCRRVRGGTHPDTLRTMNNLGVVLADAGEADGAREVLGRALKTYPRVLSPRHPEFRQAQDNIAVLLSTSPSSLGQAGQIQRLSAVNGVVEVRDFETERPVLRLTLQIMAEGQTIPAL